MPLTVKDGSVAERLAMIVDNLSISGATNIGFRYKQKDLCTLLGTQRTTLVSMLDRLSDQGIVDYDSNELKILDLQGLINVNND